jgi:hypothetical protein
MTSHESLYFLYFFDGTDLFAVMVVYSDASEIGGNLSVGSLLFRKKLIPPFEKEWRLMLRQNGLTHFHMTDCNAREGEFRGKSDAQCDACAREAIRILIKYAVRGVIFSVKKSDFQKIITPRGFLPNPFTLGAWFTLLDIRNWADQCDPIARISYVFEAGDDHQKDANALFLSIAEDPNRTAAYRYRNHAFLPKLKSLPTQAADILAWHGAKHTHRREKGNYRLRGDFDAIVSSLHVTDGYHDREWLEHLVSVAQKHAGPHGNEVAGVAMRYNSSNARQMRDRLYEILTRDG